jgi:hypothetical protein
MYVVLDNYEKSGLYISPKEKNLLGILREKNEIYIESSFGNIVAEIKFLLKLNDSENFYKRYSSKGATNE